MTKLSVVIPTYNRRKILERTLPTLLAQSLPPDEFEIIVVSDGSSDGTAEVLRTWKTRCALRVLESQHRGAGAARNAGVRAATGELILFLDDDLSAGPDLFRQHCAAHVGSDSRVVHGPIFVAPGSARTITRHVAERFYERYYRTLDPGMELRFPDDISHSILVLSSLVNSSMPRQLLFRCFGFDERIRAAEDLELGLRLWKAGAIFQYQPAAEAYEFYVKTSWEYLRGQARALGAGDLLVSREHPEFRQHSQFANLAETRPFKKLARAAIMRSPVSAAPLVSLPLLAEKLFYGSFRMREAGARLLSTAEMITRLRSGAKNAGSWKALQSEFGRRAPGLMYHHVGPARPGTYQQMTISPEQFESQMQWLARRGYVGIKPSDWLRWLQSGTGLPDKPILLTFDDAYTDTAQYALPILRKYGFGAAVFVVTARLGGTNTWDEAQGCGRLDLMSAEQIRHWATQGIEFGAHSRTHPDLTKLSAAERESEIAGSKQDLAELLGGPVVSFAYPYGEQTEPVRNLVREKFDLAFGTEEGMNHLRSDRYLMKRAFIGPDDSLTEFGLSVRLGGLQRWRDLRARFGVRSRLKKALRPHFVTSHQ
jgi:peptidoglycan/xylan/chitin deacetylase (PgdA/CDA1 family)/glycosyltransferase involved in cell wall biosynthesis